MYILKKNHASQLLDNHNLIHKPYMGYTNKYINGNLVNLLFNCISNTIILNHNIMMRKYTSTNY